MAIYHFSGTIISRSQGRSAIACAAYRSGQRLEDEYYARTHDYSQKQDVAYSEILLPEQAPAWMADRATLWNQVEEIEKRKDAQLAREFNFALPRELTLEQNIALAKEFVQQAFVDQGMVADVCIHDDHTPDGHQPHVHVMLTLREVTPDGFGKKVRDWNAKENLLVWRESWAEHANRHLFLHDIAMRIDHRTLQAQGIDLEPQHKMGAAAAKEHKAHFADHQRIAHENGKKLLENPQIALDAITRQQSTFTAHDVARFVNRHTLDNDEFQAVYAKVMACEQLVSLGKDERGQERFSTQAMLLLETQLLEHAKGLCQQDGHAVHPLRQKVALALRHLSPEQRDAFEHVVSSGDLKCVIGYAGTGKSYLLGAAREAWEAQGYQVLGATLSGIAAENLTGSSGIESRTLASRFYYWERGEQHLTRNDILVIDEAGMIGSRQLHKLLEEAHSKGAKVVLIGDPQQLQAIEAGAAFRAICGQVQYVELTDIRRQQQDWQMAATKALATGKVQEALDRYAQHHHLHAFDTTAVAKQALVCLWNDARLSDPSQTQIMLAYTRQDVQELNTLARHCRQKLGELGEDHLLLTARGEQAFAQHDRIYFLKNDRTLGVMNGTLGTIEQIQGTSLRVRLDSDDNPPERRLVSLDVGTYDHIAPGYAATVHKAQGVTVDRSYVLASKYLDAHATYVGLSRHRQSCDLFWSKEDFAHEKALARHLGQARSKDVTLDYTQDKAPDGRTTAPARTAQERAESLKAFKAEFEAQYPERAQALQRSHRPETPPALTISSYDEKLAVDALIRFEALEKRLETAAYPNLVKEQLAKHAARMVQEPHVLAYIKQQDLGLSQKIEHLAQSLERDKGRGRER